MSLLPALQPVDLPPEPIVTPDVAWSAVLPAVVLIVGALGLMVVVALSRRKPIAGAYTLYTTVVAVCAIIAALPLWDRIRPFVPSQSTLDDLDALSLTDPEAAQQLAQELGLKAAEHGPYTALAGSIGVDGFSVFVTIVICLAVILTAWTADDYLRREGLEGPELSILLLLSAAGGVVMASANDLIVMFLGLEILSIAVYVLAAMHRKRLTSQEAGVKYFVLGAFSSAFLLYGIAFVYGGTGSTNLVRIVDYFSTTVVASNGLVLAGLALMLVGFGFKVAAAPFHWWTPDVYQGSPTPVVTFMASAVKAAGFAGLLRVFYLGFETWQDDWKPIIFVLAVLTLLVGSIIAVVQTNVKRMLAYSSIGHAGFMLVGVQVASDLGVAAVLFYLAAYTFMVAGSFAVVTVVGREGDGAHRLSDYRGLARQRPGLALVFSIFLFAQAGVPLTSGFFAKFYVIGAAVDGNSVGLAIIAMLTAVIAAFLYLRIIVEMFFEADDDREPRPIAIPLGVRLTLAACLIVTIGVGLVPGPLNDWAAEAEPELVDFPESSASPEVPIIDDDLLGQLEDQVPGG
jgi:NADH-quinone oxidoreductase subunit N